MLRMAIIIFIKMEISTTLVYGENEGRVGWVGGRGSEELPTSPRPLALKYCSDILWVASQPDNLQVVNSIS